jgi:hypothetical protein
LADVNNLITLDNERHFVELFLKKTKLAEHETAHSIAIAIDNKLNNME